jgi:ferredoxin
MTYVITSLCHGTCDTACVQVCPVDAIAGPISIEALRAVAPAERGARFPGVQMFIDPDLCIDCGACVPVCPADAIVADDDVPAGEEGALPAAEEFFRGRR